MILEFKKLLATTKNEDFCRPCTRLAVYRAFSIFCPAFISKNHESFCLTELDELTFFSFNMK